MAPPFAENDEEDEDDTPDDEQQVIITVFILEYLPPIHACYTLDSCI